MSRHITPSSSLQTGLHEFQSAGYTHVSKMSQRLPRDTRIVRDVYNNLGSTFLTLLLRCRKARSTRDERTRRKSLCKCPRSTNSLVCMLRGRIQQRLHCSLCFHPAGDFEEPRTSPRSPIVSRSWDWLPTSGSSSVGPRPLECPSTLARCTGGSRLNEKEKTSFSTFE